MSRNATRRNRTAAPALGLFGAPLAADNPLVLAAEGALFGRPTVTMAAATPAFDEWALDLFGQARELEIATPAYVATGDLSDVAGFTGLQLDAELQAAEAALFGTRKGSAARDMAKMAVDILKGEARRRTEPAALVVADLPVAPYAVHYFETTEQALRAVDLDEVAEGDVLICDEESVAGVLVGSWVVAVTEDAGDFEQGVVASAFARAADFARAFMA